MSDIIIIFFGVFVAILLGVITEVLVKALIHT